MSDVSSYNLFGVEIKARLRGGVVAIGNFDGVHRGHQALLQRGRAIADQAGLPFCVLTFDPHPRRFFQPTAEPFLLSQPQAKQDLLMAQQTDGVVTLPFTEALSRLSANDFIQIVLEQGLQARHIVVGQNFVFGHGRQGHVETLLAHGFDVTALAPVMDDTGLIYSSTAVRQAVGHADLPGAAHILGRPWSITGPVIPGDQRGRTLGFPTANVIWPAMILKPVYGVYAITALLANHHVRQGIANIGVRPTITPDATHPVLEAHLFDFTGDLYGQNVTVTLQHFIRAEQAFASVADLKAQIQVDCQLAKRHLGC